MRNDKKTAQFNGASVVIIQERKTDKMPEKRIEVSRDLTACKNPFWVWESELKKD